MPNETRNVSAARDVAEPHETGAYSGQGPIYSDYPLIIHLKHWFFVMSSRPLYATLRRAPVREHMMHLVDVFIGYAARDSRYSDNPAHAAGTVRQKHLGAEVADKGVGRVGPNRSRASSSPSWRPRPRMSR